MRRRSWRKRREGEKGASLLELCFLPWSSLNLFRSPGLDMVRPIDSRREGGGVLELMKKTRIALRSPLTLHDFAGRILPPFRREPAHIVCLSGPWLLLSLPQYTARLACPPPSTLGALSALTYFSLRLSCIIVFFTAVFGGSV